MAEQKIAGSCLCGGVSYEVTGALEAMACCHCRECRKASGAEFATNGSVATRDMNFISGEELLREFESSPGQFRVFLSEKLSFTEVTDDIPNFETVPGA